MMSASLHPVSASFLPDPVEAELAKDIWDGRNIPGARFSAHRSDHLLNFTGISVAFRPALKRYIRLMVTRYSLGDCARRIRSVRLFLDFYVSRHPSTSGFQQLIRADIEAYLLHLKTGVNSYGKPNSNYHIWEAIIYLQYFLEYLERASCPEAPLIAVSKLIWPDDRGKKTQQKYTEEKYIPESVLYQLEQHMHELPPAYLPVVIILRASGWRIGDVLNLRYDTCLEHTTSGWWLCGDILKTDVQDHKVPLSEDIATIVAAQRDLVRGTFSEEDNPNRYLFPSSHKRRKGRPLYERSIRDALNRLSVACEIKNDDGIIFHFKNHAFRHTKAVELINSGMSLVHVQKWLAHLTPEMTLAYAKILDSTRRKEWEQAFAKGAVRIDVEGRPKVVNAEQLGNEQEIEWEHIRHNLDAVRLTDGYCFKPKKANCPTQDSPCYTCRHFCTTPDFLLQFEKQERELHELIQLGEKAGSAIWVERNTQKLNRVLPVIQVLRKGDLHHPAGKAMREYTPEERAKRNAG
jgi:integrase